MTKIENDNEQVRKRHTHRPKKFVWKVNFFISDFIDICVKSFREHNTCPSSLQTLLTTKPKNYSLYVNFVNETLLNNREHLLVHVTFSDESTLHLSGNVITHTVWILYNIVRLLVQLQRESQKWIVFLCHIPTESLWTFLFYERTLMCIYCVCTTPLAFS